MIRPESLSFPPLHCSVERELGDYYQDFSGAIKLVEGGFHGPVDSDGIPQLFVDGQGDFANAVSTSQYALANMTVVRAGDEARRHLAIAQLDWLVTHQEQTGPWEGCWLMQHDNPKYPWLKAPWTGALASGNAISALLRGWEMFQVDSYRSAALAAYQALHAERDADPLYQQAEGSLWYEEYPADRPLHVLNGHIYTLFAVLDVARATGDEMALRRWELAARTALSSLDRFDAGYWSVYDLRFRELTSLHYHRNIHIPQLQILARLTNDEGYSQVAARWSRYAESRMARVRWAVGLRTHRFRKSR